MFNLVSTHHIFWWGGIGIISLPSTILLSHLYNQYIHQYVSFLLTSQENQFISSHVMPIYNHAWSGLSLMDDEREKVSRREGLASNWRAFYLKKVCTWFSYRNQDGEGMNNDRSMHGVVCGKGGGWMGGEDKKMKRAAMSTHSNVFNKLRYEFVDYGHD